MKIICGMAALILKRGVAVLAMNFVSSCLTSHCYIHGVESNKFSMPIGESISPAVAFPSNICIQPLLA